MKNVLALTLISIFLSCSTTKEHTRFKYAKSEFVLQQPTSLRTDGVYLRTTTGVNYEGKTFVGYSFYRFYENGRCYAFTWQEGTPNDSILKATSKELGQRTYYRNNGNNITIELWGGSYSGYIYQYLTVDAMTLTLNAFKPRAFWTTKQKYGDIKYEFKPLNLSGKAEW